MCGQERDALTGNEECEGMKGVNRVRPEERCISGG